MNRDTIARIKKTVQSLAPELEVLRGEKGEKGDSFRWRGKHVEARKYARFDVVTKGRSAYLATEMTSQQPPDAPWVCIAQAVDGEPGERGERGVQGMIGKQGEVGPEGPRGERGEPGLRWAGAYQAGRRYEVGDVVGADGGAYVAIASTEQSPLGGAGWNTLAQGGEAGPRGMRGETGETGATGSVVSASSGSITNSTASTSTTTGAFVVTGGVGIGGAVNAGSDSKFNGVRVGRGQSNISSNTAVGTTALDDANATGGNQTAVGNGALSGASTGQFNTAVGVNALNKNLGGQLNAAMGVEAMANNTTGSSNVAVGVNALISNLTTNDNTAVGKSAMFANTGGSNTAVGKDALTNNATGSSNVAVGAEAGRLQSSSANLTATSNSIYIGANAKGFDNSDNNTIVIGASAVGTGANQTIIGTSATTKTTICGELFTGEGEAIRVGRGQANVSSNTAVGTTALDDAGATGTNQTAVGVGALSGASTGASNTAIGVNSLLVNSSGANNSAVGTSTLGANTTGSNNSAVGVNALLNTISGSSNVAVGFNAGRFQQDGSTTLTASSSSIYIGANCKGFDNSDNNTIVIGAGASGTGANQTVINTTSTTLTTIQGTSTSVLAFSGDTMRIVTQRNPASTAVGTSGDFAFGTSGGTTFLYFCIASGNWARVALTTGY